MIRLLAIFALLLWPTLALAETFAVRSGEHAGFSRLFIPFGIAPEWEFGRVEGGYELRPKNKTMSYDLSRVFELIPRDRILAVENRPEGRLFISIGCDCHADAFEVASGLAIDVKDGNADGNPAFERELPPPGTDPGRTADGQQVLPMTEPADRPDLGHRFLGNRTEYAWNQSFADPAPQPDAKPDMQAVGPLATVPETPRDRVADVQAALVEQLGRAAAQGLVSIDLSETEARLRKASPELRDDPPEHEEGPKPDAIVDAITGPHVRIETAVDRGNKPAPNLPAMTTDGTNCQLSEDFDIAAWGIEPRDAASVSLSRSSIIGEFDAADPASIEALAKHYIYLTFGAEARALITTFDADLPNKKTLLAIAEIMDFGKADTAALEKVQMSCDTRAAMWAVLAADSLMPGDRIDKKAVVSAFAELPLHLRRHLGRFLTERFLQIDDLDTASAIRNAIARAPGDHGESFDLMEAEIALELGNDQAGLEQLDVIAAEDGPLAPEAIIKRIDSTIAAAGTIPADLIETAAAFAFEARGSELGADMLRAYLRASAYGGDILKAHEATLAAENDKSINDETAESLLLEIYTLAAETPSDPEFLQVALSAPLVLDQSKEANEIRRRFAERLISLGLSEPARDALTEIKGVPGPAERILFARSFLQERRPDMAIGYLAGLTDPESSELRAKSHALAGEYERASAVFAAVGNEEARARADWRGEIWEQASETGTEAERAAASLALQPTTDDDPAAGPLARNRAMLERSQIARERLADLLETTAKP